MNKGKKKSLEGEQELEEIIEDIETEAVSTDKEQEKTPKADEAETSTAEGKGPSKEEEEENTRYLRLAADFQNYKRRTEKEKSDIYAYANEKIVTELLDVIDNFERALLHKESCSDKGILEGMTMIFKQLKGVLEKSGTEEIKAIGETFDPNFHHAVMTETSIEYESGKVTLVLQKGYMLNGKVIRPSMVKVAQ